jgi:hypothetical protein
MAHLWMLSATPLVTFRAAGPRGCAPFPPPRERDLVTG